MQPQWILQEIKIPPCGLWRHPCWGKISKHLRLGNLGVPADYALQWPNGKDSPPNDCMIIHQPFEASNQMLGEGENITNQDVDRVLGWRWAIHHCRLLQWTASISNSRLVGRLRLLRWWCLTGFNRDFSKDTMQLPGTGTFFKDTTNQRLTMFRRVSQCFWHFDA